MKAPRSAPLPRKRPSQERSKSTVTSILQAASEVIVQSGREQASIAAIVRRAGVSAGTFYQYFPNKEALLAAVVQQQLDNAAESIRSDLKQLPQGPLPVLLEAAVQASVSAWRRAGPVLRAAQDPVTSGPAVHALPFSHVPLLHHLLEPGMSKVAPRKRQMLTLLIETLVSTVVQRTALEDFDMLDLLEEELPEILTACVRHTAPHSSAK